MSTHRIGACLCVAALMSALVTAPAPAQTTVRFATFNSALSDAQGVAGAGQLATLLSAPGNADGNAIAEIIQRNNPDVVLLQEFDTDLSLTAINNFQTNYLGISQNGAGAVNYPHVYVAASNTGIPSGFDYNNDGDTTDPEDAYGFGNYAGEFGMILLSKYPIDSPNVRTFQEFLWTDMPGNLLPTPFYDPAEAATFRLSSKSHWDVPILINGETVHVLADHPTPPVFDDPVVDENGRRNHDEIRFWSDYITPGAGGYIYDDNGLFGQLAANDSFVVLGDHNADPLDGDSVASAADQLLLNPFLQDPMPTSLGAVEDTNTEGGLNLTHLGNPALDTSDFNPNNPGNLRVDFALPSDDLTVLGSEVFWPEQGDPLGYLVPNFPNAFSDHRLVWVDVVVPEPATAALLTLGVVLMARRRRAGSSR